MNISLIVAYANNRVIGKDNDLVWRLPDDMKYFTRVTTGHHVIMGRKNWESIPPKYRPLPNRTNIILTRNEDFSLKHYDAIILHSLNEAIEYARSNEEAELFIIGGAQIYKEGLSLVDTMYITEINGEPDGDTYFPEWNPDEWKELSREHHPKDEKHKYSFDFVVYKRRLSQ